MPVIPGFLRLRLDDPEFQDNLDLTANSKSAWNIKTLSQKGEKIDIKGEEKFSSD